MKLWAVFIGLLFTPALQAQSQIPFYDYPNSIYYSGTNYPLPYYPPSLYATSPLLVSEPNTGINDLARQVQYLSEELQLLRIQMLLAQQSQVRAAETSPSSFERAQQSLALILKNGRWIIATGYAIAGQTLWVMTPGGTERISLSDIDIDATQRANSKRGMLFGNGS